jgi:outer membrane protein
VSRADHAFAFLTKLFKASVLPVLVFVCSAIACFIANATTVASYAAGQEPGDTPPALRAPIQQLYSLTAAVDTSLRNFPTLRYAKARVMQTRAGITLARTAYLPNFDLLFQELRTTTNVIAGAIFPQTLDVIPMQTGAEKRGSSFNSVFANNTGANFSWELWDFGLRHANVNLAKTDYAAANAQVRLTDLDVAAAAAEAYLQTVAAKQTIRAQKATVKRMEAWALIVHTLVDKGLRPGVDAARADADLSFARIALIEAERETELARVDLSESMGLAGNYIGIDDAPWIKRPSNMFNAQVVDLALHPYAVLRTAEVKTAGAQVQVLNKTYYPHIWFHSAIWGRGSGVRNNVLSPVADGAVPQVANWVAGFSMSFPAADIFKIRAQKRMAIQNEQARRANYDLAIQVLTQKDARAKILLDNARRIADETPVLIKAAKENEIKALERYRVGLSTIVEVAEAERILARAEVEDAVAEVRVWRSILATAYAQGNLSPFMSLVASAEGGK